MKIIANEQLAFPSPREMNGFISHLSISLFMLHLCSRPLSRYTGLYLRKQGIPGQVIIRFRPLSSYTGLYRMKPIDGVDYVGFPSPPKVNRFISDCGAYGKFLVSKFPSPREVDRFISRHKRKQLALKNCFRPLLR